MAKFPNIRLRVQVKPGKKPGNLTRLKIEFWLAGSEATTLSLDPKDGLHGHYYSERII